MPSMVRVIETGGPCQNRSFVGIAGPKRMASTSSLPVSKNPALLPSSVASFGPPSFAHPNMMDILWWMQ